MFGRKKIAPPETLERMEAAIFPVAALTFAGEPVTPTLKILSHVEVKSCGDFSLIETAQDIINKKHKKVTYHELSQYIEAQYNIVRLSLISPTYDEIIGMIEEKIDIVPLKDTMKAIEESFYTMKDGREKKEMQEEYALLEMKARYILPHDFVAGVMSCALDVDRSDIKIVTENMLYEAATKAYLGKDNPSDHMHGRFTEFNKEDIDNRAWIIYYDKVKEQSPKKLKRK